MKAVKFFLFILAGLFFFFPLISQAEVKMDAPSGGVFPKLPKTADDPILENSHVYPFWGPVCQRYTYSVVYRDKEGRAPEYVKMYFNGEWLDIAKENPEDNDYKRGVKYIYKYVPTSTDSNFYFFEASNGKGKARDGIIDSPDNGPVLFTSSLDQNEIAVLDRESGEFLWRFPTNKEWVSEVVISGNSEYLAAKTSSHIYLFKLSSGDLVWQFDAPKSGEIGGDVAGGVDISRDGSLIVATMGNTLFAFSSASNKPIWEKDTGDNAYGVSISGDGKYIGVATAGSEEIQDSNLLMLFQAKDGKLLWQYHSSGNFHGVDLSGDGGRIAAATGCPDRRAYVFGRDSNEPLIRTEMLTRDSPVDEAVISADGRYAAFGSESDQGGVHFFDINLKSNTALWQFPMPEERSVRALSMTPSGQYIGAAAFGGDAYIFSSQSAKPSQHYFVRERLGAVDISDDGAFLTAGGSNKNIYLWKNTPPARSGETRGGVSRDPLWTQEANEYLNSLDISADNKYVALGTGGSVYFFESDDFNLPEKQVCSKVIEPPAEPSGTMKKGNGGFSGEADLSGCGNNICNPDFGETSQTCPKDCKENDDEAVNQNQPLDRRAFPILLLILPLGIIIVLAVVVIIFWKKGIWGKLWMKIRSFFVKK
ncbi:MAG: PQQ-binding-like beta-propeller repeat protein [bacterium]|nr:PQQ-binding-like beta-propeller repeat protein [bacterium]